MYTFIKCQTHPKCPDLVGWYLVLPCGDIETLEILHAAVAEFYFIKFGLDPHYKNDIYHMPMKLVAGWWNSVHVIWKDLEDVLVNSSGGLLPLSAVTILDEVESDKLFWMDKYNDEKIIISRWPEGKHWYLTSNHNRVFCPSKYNSEKEAYEVAKIFTDKIKVKN
jgi:hypothetical protein